MRTTFRIRFVLVAALIVTSAVTSAAQDSSLSGNTLVCTNASNPRFPSVRTLYFSGQRIFQYDATGKKSSSAGIIYDIGSQRSGHGSGDLTYESSASVSGGQISLTATVTQTCGICDGRKIMVEDKFTVSLQGAVGNATRNYRQWFPDGTQAAVPGGSDSYSCRLTKGRTGVGR